MDDRRTAKAGAQNPAYRQAHPPSTALTCAGTTSRCDGAHRGTYAANKPLVNDRDVRQHPNLRGTNHASRRITPATIDLYADPDGSHVQRLVNAAWLLGKAEGWDSLIH